MRQLPKKAIIAVAGTGTRFLPATKEVPKEMLPIIDKPIVEYSVDEVVASGVDNVILVTREGNNIIKNHFEHNLDLEKQLKETNKKEYLERIKAIPELAKFNFIKQNKEMPYGNATPLLASMDLLDDEPFFYLFGDDMTLANKPVCQQLAEVYQKNPEVGAVIAVQKMPREVLYRYGVVKIKGGTNNEYEQIIEKPALGEEPSDVVSFGRYLFSSKILPIIKKLKTGKDNELWLVDALNELAQTEKILVHTIEGQWLTTGDALNYLKTTVEFIKQRDDLRNEFEKYVVESLRK